QLGNSEVPGAEYPHLFQVVTTPDYGLNGQTVVRAPAPRGFVNPDLVWETNETVDLGVESGLFQNRIFFSATYYRRNTKNFLVNVPVSYTSGFSLNEVYGNFTATAPALNISNNRPQAGDLCFQDTDGNDTLDARDRTYLGKAIPDFYYGLTLNASYRHFDLSLFFSGVGGVQKFDTTAMLLESVSGGGANRSVAVLNHWTPTHPSNTVPRAIVGDSNQHD